MTDSPNRTSPQPSSSSSSLPLEPPRQLRVRQGTEIVPFDATRMLRRLREQGTRLTDSQLNLVISRTLAGLRDEVSTSELDDLLADCAANMAVEGIEYGVLAGRVAFAKYRREIPATFADYLELTRSEDLIDERLYQDCRRHLDRLETLLQRSGDLQELSFFGLRTLQNGYLFQRRNGSRKPFEHPKYAYLRVAMQTFRMDDEWDLMCDTYLALCNNEIAVASPILFSAASPSHSLQFASCFVLTVPDDSVYGMYEGVKQSAVLMNNLGGVGVSLSGLRAYKAPVRNFNGRASGIVKYLMVLDATCQQVSQGGGKRPGALAAYLENWHADVYDFLNMRRVGGSEESKARSIFYGLWVSDEFMRRVQRNEDWSLMCPYAAPGLDRVYGEEFERLYRRYESEGRFRRRVRARELLAEMIKTMIETGNPYLMFKDHVNRKNNQRNLGVIRGSNLCSEICLYFDKSEIAVCLLGAVVLTCGLVKGRPPTSHRQTPRPSPRRSSSHARTQEFIRSQSATQVPAQTTSSLSQATSNLSQTTPDLSEPTFNFMQTKPNLSQPTPNLVQPTSNNLVQPTPNLVQPTSNLPTPNLVQPTSNLVQPTANATQTTQPTPNLSQTKPNLSQPTPNLVQTKPNLSQPTSDLLQPKPQPSPSSIPQPSPPAAVVETEAEAWVRATSQRLETLNNSGLPTYVTNEDGFETSVCFDAVAPKFRGTIFATSHAPDCYYDLSRLRNAVRLLVEMLDRFVDLNKYSLPETERSMKRNRPLGIGVHSLANVFAALGLPFESLEARLLNRLIFEHLYYYAMERSSELAAELGPYATFHDSPMAQGELQPDMWHARPVSASLDWHRLREQVRSQGLRNSTLTAIMPTASTAQIRGNNESVEPFTSNVFFRRVKCGQYVVVNRQLVQRLDDLGLWTADVHDQIIAHEGSVARIHAIPASVRAVYKTAWEISQRTTIDMAADRGPFIDQSQSMNIWMSQPSMSKLSSMFVYAWKRGLKTAVYYLRTKPAFSASKTAQSKFSEEESAGGGEGAAGGASGKPSGSFAGGDEKKMPSSGDGGGRLTDATLQLYRREVEDAAAASSKRRGAANLKRSSIVYDCSPDCQSCSL